MSRRIDALYCTSETVAARIQSVMVEVQDSSASARRKVEDAVKERIEALECSRCLRHEREDWSVDISQAFSGKLDGQIVVA